ncbi:MAG: Ger(x)C family spore germination C-terminal domain-containing protein [Oscillospiraceae bacterium]|nr:Ger(x)C family spore germination C-terminal domain-containing protein [Oscillospiraceae bacterium]
MKRSVITVLIIFLVVGIMGGGHSLPHMTEITLAEPIFLIGLDRANKSAQASKVSIIYEKIEAADEGGDSVNQKHTDSAEASSPAAALEALKKRFPREMATSTADYFLIGAAAAESLAEYIDFLKENNNLRLTASVFIVKGEASEAALILTETKTLDILRNYGEYSGIGAFSSELKFYELLSEWAGNGAFVIPTLVIKEHADEKIVVPGGYAIIKDGVLAGFIENGAARGYNIIKNKSVYSIVELNELNAAVRLENTESKINFNLDGNNLKEIVIDVKISAKSASKTVGEDFTALEREQNRVILNELQKTIDASRNFGCDFLGLGEMLRMRHPLKWEQIKAHWEEIYLQTPVTINITR